MDYVLHFLIDGIIAIVIATLMLICGLLFLPDALSLKILRFFKPDLIEKTPFMARVRDAFEIMLGKKAVVPPAGAGIATKSRLAAIQANVREREILQGNLYFLDLLKNLTGMLYFAVVHEGQPKESALNIIDQSLNYLRAYSQKIKNSATFKTETDDLALANESLGRVVMDAQKFLRETGEGERELSAVKTALRQGVERFDSYMKDRYEATNTAIETKSQNLAQLLANHMESEEV